MSGPNPGPTSIPCSSTYSAADSTRGSFAAFGDSTCPRSLRCAAAGSLSAADWTPPAAVLRLLACAVAAAAWLSAAVGLVHGEPPPCSCCAFLCEALAGALLASSPAGLPGLPAPPPLIASEASGGSLAPVDSAAAATERRSRCVACCAAASAMPREPSASSATPSKPVLSDHDAMITTTFL